ncbi:MAG: hypothetical protein Q8P50_18235 [Bacillota bacterium]|nr:hypothetical protein [Bacillota bacterium]
MQHPQVRRVSWPRVLLGLLFLALVCAAGVFLVPRLRPAGETAPSGKQPQELWRVSLGHPLPVAALATGDTLACLQEQGNSQIVQIDGTGKIGWKEALPGKPAGTRPTSRGLLVFAPTYVRFYGVRGLLWQYKPDLQVIWAFPTEDGGAVISFDTDDPDPREGPFSERVSYLDPKGKKVWDRTARDRTLFSADSSADGETLVTLSLSQASGAEAIFTLYKRSGTVLGEYRGAGNLFCAARVATAGDMTVMEFADRVSAVSAAARWSYQLDGEATGLGLSGRKDVLALVRPKARNPVFDLLAGCYLVSISAGGTKNWQQKVPAGSYGLWVDGATGTAIVATPDGLKGYDSGGVQSWEARTPSAVRAVSFFKDGSFLAVLSSGTLVHYRR